MTLAKIRMPTLSLTPNSCPSAWPDSTVPVAVKPMYIRHTSTIGMAAPRTPNCTRLEIICGRPSFGPCAACRAITPPPSTWPMNRPISDQNTSPPSTTARAPVTMAVICRLAPSQRVNWL
ncbi:hypothetical protein D3C78_423710 [compost metagenome]